MRVDRESRRPDDVTQEEGQPDLVDLRYLGSFGVNLVLYAHQQAGRWDIFVSSKTDWATSQAGSQIDALTTGIRREATGEGGCSKQQAAGGE